MRAVKRPGEAAGSQPEGLLVTLQVGGNEAAFQFRLTVIAGESRMLIEPIDVMAFGDNGKVTAMKACWSADSVTQL